MMSIYFVLENSETLWNPASVSARLFVDQAESVARLIGTGTGLGPVRADEVTVDRAQFLSFAKAFVEHWLQMHSSSSARMLVDGCLGIVGALACRLEPGALGDAPEVAELIARGRKVVG